MCCIMEENDKKLRRRGGRVVPGTCECNFDEPKFYDIIVFNEENEYWSCRYGCMVEIIGVFSVDTWEDGRVEKAHESKIQITYDISSIQSGGEEVNILIVKEENLKHVWCKVSSINK